jgi:hypothetical protein
LCRRQFLSSRIWRLRAQVDGADGEKKLDMFVTNAIYLRPLLMILLCYSDCVLQFPTCDIT